MFVKDKLPDHSAMKGWSLELPNLDLVNINVFQYYLIILLVKANNLREIEERGRNMLIVCWYHKYLKHQDLKISHQEDNAMMKNVSFVMELLFPES